MNQTQKHTTGKKLLALLLALVMMLSLLPTSVLATSSEPTVVIAGSDFQNPNGDTAGAQMVTNILTQMGYTNADGFLFCGDYNHSYDTTADGLQGHIDALDAAVSKKYSSIAAENRVYVQGNHDQVTAGTGGLAQSGANDPTGDSAGKYGVFVINEDDYMWHNSDKSRIQQTANNLKSYLDAKVTAKYAKPIFVVSHLPLHYSMRTKNDRDGMYANYIFDVLNDAGAKGLNIIFLYGHDHSNGWDDYLGGSCVYLAKGDKINIAQASQTDFKEKTLNFTYMNAGYTGYYSAVNSGAETTLTMTVFSITGDTVQVERYSADGVHNLKSKGVTNSSKNEGEYYAPNTAVYASPQTIALGSVTPSVTVYDGNVSVTAPGLTGLTATKTNPSFDTSKYSAYVSYDINPEGYTPGDNATVKITLDENDGFDISRKVIVIDQTGKNAPVRTDITNGKVTFTTNHFSTYDIAQEAPVESTERTYTLVTSLDELVSDDQYLLIYNGTKFVLPKIVTRSNDSGERRTGMDLEDTSVASGGPTTITGQYQAKEWRLVGSSGGWLLSNGTQQIKLTDTGKQGITATFEDVGSPFSLNFNTSHLVSFTHGNWELNYNQSRDLINGYDSTSTAARMYIYRLTDAGTVDPDEPTSETIRLYVGKSTTRTISGEYYTEATTNSHPDVVEVQVDGTAGQEGSTTTNYSYNEANVTCNNIISDNHKSWQETNYYYKVGENYYPLYAKRSSSKNSYTYTWGYSTTGSSNNVTQIGTQRAKKSASPNITVYTRTESTTTIPTVPASTTVTFKGLAVGTSVVTFGSHHYTVIVREADEYPTFPNEGSVRVGKTASATNFPGTGVAKVELTATGVPVKKGVDVIVMVDTSSSMNNYVDGQQRIDVLRQSLMRMMDTFQETNADGTEQDIRVAIADFNGYVTSGEDNTPYRLKSVDHLKDTTTRSGSNTAKVYTGSTQLNADAFVTAEQAASVISSIETHSGTNYDYAFDATYQLGEAILAQNAQDGEDRDLFVIFMSDGAPFQYNYFSSQSEAANWNNWLQGTVTDNMWDSNAHNYFYNGSGNKHRMAEAIKGDPNARYTVIRKDSTENYDGQQYMTQLPGLGATMYSIGFCLKQDNQITVESMEHVLRQIASSEDYYYTATNASQLDDAFSRITSAIKYAATNARFVDTMGANYNLQMANTVGSGITLETAPTITVTDYAIYKTSDVGNYVGGKRVTADMVGKRTGSSTTLETVRFNTTGTQAFSDKIGGGATNILKGGVICAKTFWYNTTGSAVSIDTNGDGTYEYSLAPETFYWKMGTIGESELALSYYVYLDGSMEGKREAGSYPTNESAVLYYTNYLDHEVHKDTVSPRMPWKAAHVNYAFYLVDQDGNVITDMTAGTTGTFANKIALTNPTLFGEVLLNNNETVQSSVVAKNVLPVGYELYNDDAQYVINIHSGAGSNWVITDTSATTYVTDYNGNNYTNETNVNDSSYDYTHTTVWFAVKYVSKPINDTVVVDFGLPVDISVLSNDMLPADAVVSAISHDESTITSTTCTGTYGTLSINQGGKSVRYEMNVDNGMQMQPEVFYYATTKSSYSATLTIIPATTVYYEDSFVTTSNSSPVDGTYGVWTTEGETDSKTQAEDRPGTASVLADANNLYGYDAAYANFTLFSLGSAKKVTVNAATGKPTTAPTASFTFTGTGFDIISLTDNKSGTIVVTVKNTATNETKNYSVNNYFGYTYSDGDGTWTPTDSANPNALYQVPVIKVEDLTYGTYDVTIKVAYLKSLDQHDARECSFWLDAVRVYDPAKNDETAKKAYSADKESSPDYAEVRNLLIDGNAFAVDGASVTGAVFIDGISSGATIKQFTVFGPNNEAYLKADQAIAFQLVANSVPESVQLGAKLAAGNSATLYFNGKEFKTLSTATDMYYALSGLNWTKDKTNDIYTSDVVVLQHNGGDGIISLTNIKITGGAKFNETSADPLNEVKLAKEPVVMALASPQMAARALKMVAVYEEPAPEILSVVADSAEVMVGDTVKLTVTTNADTDYILVNAAAVETYTEDEAGNRVWTYEAKAEEPGEVSFTVTAMSADGHESEESTCTVDVQQPAKPANDIAAMVKKAMNAFRKIFDAIFGWRR